MKITSYNHHVRRLLSFREALVLKPRLPDSIEPSLLSNQFFRVLCERVGTFSRSRRESAFPSFSAAYFSHAAQANLIYSPTERLARERPSDSTFRAMSHFPHFSSAGAEYTSPAREPWVEIATTESCREDTITSCAFGSACFSRKQGDNPAPSVGTGL